MFQTKLVSHKFCTISHDISKNVVQITTSFLGANSVVSLKTIVFIVIKKFKR